MNYPDSLRFIKFEEHPKIIQGLLSDSETKSYYLGEEIMHAIAAL